MDRLFETAAQPGSAIAENLAREKEAGPQVDSAIVERKQDTMEFPIGIIAQQAEAARNSERLNSEREFKAEPERLRVDNQIGFFGIRHFLQAPGRHAESDRLVQIRDANGDWTQHPQHHDRVAFA